VSKKLLIIFYRNPELGKVKTRLASTMGDDKALAIYFQLASHTRNITQNLEIDKVVYYTEYVDTEDNWENKDYKKSLQHGDILGARMFNAFTEGFSKNYSSICIIGTDCWDLTHELIQEAFKMLENHDAVLGPAKDGGYYLLGLNHLHAEIFMEKSWSTNKIAQETIDTFNQLNLKFQLLPALNDVDEEKDLPVALRKIIGH
jgi:hypothetical protein